MMDRSAVFRFQIDIQGVLHSLAAPRRVFGVDVARWSALTLACGVAYTVAMTGGYVLRTPAHAALPDLSRRATNQATPVDALVAANLFGVARRPSESPSRDAPVVQDRNLQLEGTFAAANGGMSF